MQFMLQPYHILVAALIGWANERQQQIIEFQNDQIKALLKKLGKKRVLLTDDQRRVLAVKGHALGRKALLELTTIVTPDTILRWHRELVAKKWDHSDKRKTVGRPRIRQVIVDSILRFARENPTWGYDRIQGALANVGYHIADSTVANVLKAHGIEPAPDRQRSQSWITFLKAHWDSIYATDFTTAEVWTRSGLVTFYVLAVMHLKTRRVQIAGITPSPNAVWMSQVCRSLKSESLSRMIFFGKRSLERAVAEYVEHYHVERNHQGLENALIEPGEATGSENGTIDCRERLGGMLKYYHRRAA
jgi:putative transposase